MLEGQMLGHQNIPGKTKARQLLNGPITQIKTARGIIQLGAAGIGVVIIMQCFAKGDQGSPAW